MPKVLKFAAVAAMALFITAMVHPANTAQASLNPHPGFCCGAPPPTPMPPIPGAH